MKTNENDHSPAYLALLESVKTMTEAEKEIFWDSLKDEIVKELEIRKAKMN
jgi:hypothetical protein